MGILPVKISMCIDRSPLHRLRSGFFGLMMGGCGMVGMAHAQQPTQIDFSRDVRPILSNRCFKCHGPDEQTRKGGLRLDNSSSYRPAKSGAVSIVPGKPEESELLHRIYSSHSDEQMPPPESKIEMSKEEKDVLKRWIEAGAEYDEHWAFKAPVKVDPPSIRGRDAAHPIDAFLLKSLHERGWDYTPKADRRTLARRASLDLIGMPPDWEWVEAFVQDTSPDAWEKYIDFLLAQPAYGERWARRWLDLARYADTNGYEKDRPRNIWPWRDWVIRALNEDMPFDVFTIKQLAGDMLPGATQDDLIATGFHRNSMINEEGGNDPLEFRFHAMNDRVATTGATWMGMTLSCAQCHTHKYDPIQHEEYYQIKALLNNADDVNLDLIPPDFAEKDAKKQAEARQALLKIPNQWPIPAGVETADWITVQASTVVVTASEGVLISSTPENIIQFKEQGLEREVYTIVFDHDMSPQDMLRLEVLVDPENSEVGPGKTSHGNFVLSEIQVEVQPQDDQNAPWQPIPIVNATATLEQNQYPVKHAFDGNPNTGWAVHQPPHPTKQNRTALFHLGKNPEIQGNRRYRVTLHQNFGSFHTIANLRLSLGKNFKEGDPRIEEIDKARRHDFEQRFQAWFKTLKSQMVPWTAMDPDQLESNEPILTLENDSVVFVSGDTTKDDRFVLTFRDPPKKAVAFRLEVLTDPRLPSYGPGKTYYEGTPGDFFLQEIMAIADGKPLKWSRASTSHGTEGGVMIDGDFQTGWSIPSFIGENAQAVLELEKPLAENGEPVKELKIELRMGRYYASTLGKFRLSYSEIPNKASARDLPRNGEKLVLKDPSQWSEDEKLTMVEAFLLGEPLVQDQVNPIRRRLKSSSPPHTLVLKEREKNFQRKTYLRTRGEFTQPTREVEPDVPAFLPPLPKNQEKNRLTFAKWLVSREHPLTARVNVNRHWHAFFGTGLVKTLDDFGFQGEAPSHPELLDWLAIEWMDMGWSMKKLHRLIVTSEAYQQSSVQDEATRARDPENRLLSRGARQRIEAEMIRDTLLKASGILSSKMYGPPVKPPQPASVTESSYAGFDWRANTGEDRFRRGIYTFMKRTAPFASFQAFDAPNGESCVARRDVSNTPIQSLVLLNDMAYYEIAQAFGKFLVNQPGSVEERLKVAFRRVLTRDPASDEQTWFEAFYQSQRARFESQELNAKEVTLEGQATPEQAAWVMVSRVLFNLDEAISKN